MLAGRRRPCPSHPSGPRCLPGVPRCSPAAAGSSGGKSAGHGCRGAGDWASVHNNNSNLGLQSIAGTLLTHPSSSPGNNMRFFSLLRWRPPPSAGANGILPRGRYLGGCGRPGAAAPACPHSSSAPSRELAAVRAMDEEEEILRAVERDNVQSKAFVDSWNIRMRETSALLKQVREPGSRGSYLKDSEKQEMYRLHKEDPGTYTVERLAKDFRVMRQRVHAILWLKEMEEEEERKQGKPLDDSVEILLDSCPEFFNSHDREFHVASLPYKPDFKVMPEDWDGTTRDPDEVLYEISMKEDQMLYEEFVQRLEFNKKKVAGEVKCHKYSRRRPDEGWTYMVEKLGPQGRRGTGGGWKFISLPDGSSRPLNDMEKMYVKRETPKRRRRIIAPFK